MSISRIDKSPRLSLAVAHQGTVYLTGQVGEAGASAADQTRQILASIDTLLEKAGTDKSRLLQATIWLADIGDFAEMNSVWDTWIDPQNPPARSTGRMDLLEPGHKLEITVVAAT
ncbi:RidA family protein [Pseudomonas sp. LB3P38]|uniref:RidA family protein n=1 Tax=Pseudomonas lyxosi TaxID=3398358 RepID=UPI0039EDFE60